MYLATLLALVILPCNGVKIPEIAYVIWGVFFLIGCLKAWANSKG